MPVVQYAVSLFGGAAKGGVQGLSWWAASLKVDEDGDVANEFLCEGATQDPSCLRPAPPAEVTAVDAGAVLLLPPPSGRAGQ